MLHQDMGRTDVPLRDYFCRVSESDASIVAPLVFALVLEE